MAGGEFEEVIERVSHEGARPFRIDPNSAGLHRNAARAISVAT